MPPIQPDPPLLRAIELHRAGARSDAERQYRQILANDPNRFDAMYFLGVLLWQVGRIDEAVAAFKRAVALNPRFALAHTNLGMLLHQRGKVQEAIACHRKAIESKPGFAMAYTNLGNALHDARQTDEAIAMHRQAVRLEPDSSDAYFGLANLLYDVDQLDESIAAFRGAIRLKPGFVDAHNNLGSALLKRGLLEESIAQFQEAVRIQPGYTRAMGNWGHALYIAGRFDEAEVQYRRAIALDPADTDARNNFSELLRRTMRFDEALEQCRMILKLRPTDGKGHINLATTLKDLGRIEEAVASYRDAVALLPHDVRIHADLVYALPFDPRSDQAAVLSEARRWDEVHAGHLARDIKPLANDRNPDRRLRIGYVSADFLRHCQSLFTIPLLSAHNRRDFEIFCYSSVATPDDFTQRIQALPDVWRDVAGETDARLAEIVRNDRIDILVDLTMHMARNRPLLFARKPAPIQVAWLAYPGTTGLSAMDYRLSDPYLDPPSQHDADYSETTLRLPETFWCYDPLVNEPAVNNPPAVQNGYATFGCLNNFCKINSSVLALWAKVLQAVNGSHLLMMAPDGSARTGILEAFERHGIDPNRIAFVPFQKRPAYLQTYQSIDIALDTFPYNGHTTSLDSYWMGVPVVTLVGKTVVGRAGWSQLNNLGMRDLAAQTLDEFVHIAVSLAADLSHLAQIRATLRSRMEQSPLMDASRFARNIEAAYREMWTRYVAR